MNLNAESTIVYMTDCTLATVSSMAMLKARKKSEFERQIKIAQTGIDSIVSLKIDHTQNKIHSIRIEDILKNFAGNVEQWAKKYTS